MDEKCEKRYTLAKRGISLEELIVTGVMSALMIVWACLTEDIRFLFIPLFFLLALFSCFITFLFRYVTAPKIAIQADCNGIYFYYRSCKAIFINYSDIVKITKSSSYCRGGRASAEGRITVFTETAEYKSIRVEDASDAFLYKMQKLVDTDNKEEYLIKIAIKQ